MSGYDHTTVCRLHVLDVLHLLTKLPLARGTVDIVVSLLFTYLDLGTPNDNTLDLSH